MLISKKKSSGCHGCCTRVRRTLNCDIHPKCLMHRHVKMTSSILPAARVTRRAKFEKGSFAHKTSIAFSVFLFRGCVTVWGTAPDFIFGDCEENLLLKERIRTSVYGCFRSETRIKTKFRSVDKWHCAIGRHKVKKKRPFDPRIGGISGIRNCTENRRGRRGIK